MSLPRHVLFQAVWVLSLCVIAPVAQVEPKADGTDLDAFARELAGGASSDFEKTQNVVKWLATRFEWTATDYQSRTVNEIIERQGGNCYELSLVTRDLLDRLGVQRRTIREINIHEYTPERQRTAEQKVAENGPRMSVFGERHNDHVWLEVYDQRTGEWYPSDPSMGVVGIDEWLQARLAFGQRRTLNPISLDMIVPFIIVAYGPDGGTIDRTHDYLVEAFDRYYEGRLHMLPSWKAWVEGLDSLHPAALGALNGEVNLHRHGAAIHALQRTYESLKAEYLDRYGTGGER